jgi:hypothetical protein
VKISKSVWVTTLAAALLAGCGGKKACDPDVDDNCPSDAGGDLPIDICNNKNDAETNPKCQLVACSDAGMPMGCQDPGGWCFDSFSGDQDYWLAPLPSAPTAGTLLHISGGIGAPETALNFAITVLKEDGTTAVTRGVDHHGTQPPKPVDLIIPFTDPKLSDLIGVSGAKLLLLVGDEAAVPMPYFDVRNPYNLTFCMQANPDMNEPNDDPSMATNIPLTAGTNGPTGTTKGYLATTNDVDYFQFDASAAMGKIIYLHVTGPAVPPFPTYQMEYTLFDPNGVPIANDVMANQLLQIDLATARKVATPGIWKVKLDGYQSANGMMTPVPGDLNTQYTLTVEILDELDTNDTPPNDSPQTPKVITMGINSQQGLVGRLSYVPDPDYYQLDLQPTASAGIIKYKLTVDQTPGRFAALTKQGHTEDRQVRVLQVVSAGTTLAEQQMNCTGDDNICPKGYDGAADFGAAQQLVSSLCALSPQALCLWAERDQDPNFDMTGVKYRNMEGEVPVAPHPGGVVSFLIVSQDDENDYADDRVYTLQVSYEGDADETLRDGLPFQTQVSTLAGGGSITSPPAAGQLTGELTFGYGRLTQDAMDWFQMGTGVRGSQDYDAYPEDYDRFEIDFPGGLVGDQTWELQWDIDYDGGSPPGDLALEVTFCNAANYPDGGCPGPTPVLVYSGDRIQPWYGQSLTDRQVLYSQTDNGMTNETTALDVGCFCYESQYVAEGHYFVNVGAANRKTNDRIKYRIRQGYGAYPQSFAIDGGSQACPSGDGGCGFTSAGP